MKLRGVLSEADRGVLAVAALVLAVAASDPIASTVLALLGLFFVWSRVRSGATSPNLRLQLWIAGSTGVLALLVRMRLIVVASLLEVSYVVLVLITLGMGTFYGLRRRGRALAIAAGIAAMVVGTLTIAVDWWEASVGPDVYMAHVSAGEALAESQNPYTAAVSIRDTSKFAPPGTMIEGYNYPPVILVTYGLAAMFTDPRVVSVLAWFVVVGWLGVVAARSDARSSPAFALFLLLSTFPVWPAALFVGWSEPLSAALLLAAAVFWTRYPKSSAAAFGLALGSKQYFVLLAPLVLVQLGWRQGRRTLILGTAAVSLLVGAVVFGIDNLYKTLVLDLLAIPFRPDTLSLPGLLVALGFPAATPRISTLMIAPVAALAFARNSFGFSEVLLRSAITLGTVFVLGVGLPNYWLMVLLMVTIALVAAPLGEPSTDERLETVSTPHEPND
jgi:hypothetical protein